MKHVSISFVVLFMSHFLVAQSIQDFPWLATIINTQNCCFNESVDVYQMAGQDFIYVVNDPQCGGEGGTLYAADGTLWCQATASFRCLDLYELSNPTSLSTCAATSTFDVFGEFPWLSSLANFADCSSEKIRMYQNEAQQKYVHVSQGGTDSWYFETGDLYCTSGPNYHCPSLYGFEEMQIIAEWTCGDGGTSSTSLPNFVAYSSGMNPLLPEGIAFDPNRQAFIISSAAAGVLSTVALDGTLGLFAPPQLFAGNGTFGLQIDANNDRLLAVSSNLQNPTVANLFMFKLSDGSLINNVNLANLSPGLNFVNDVAVDAAGNAYVTNSDQGIIFKVDMEGNASIFFQDASFTPADPTMETGFNGIEYHPDGYLIISHYVSNKIYKLDLSNPSSITEVALPQGFIRGGDGMYLDGRELVVVNNAGVPFVSKFVSTDAWATGTLDGDTYATGDIFPTAVVKVGEEYMVSNSYLNYPAYGSLPTNYLISKANFDSSKRYAGSATEIPRVNTPIMPFGYGTDYPAPFYTDCNTPIAEGIPDLQGEWVEQTVMIDGTEFPANTAGYSERIEQCGNRILVASSGLLHEFFMTDNTMFNGANDVNIMGQPVHATGRFEGNSLILTGVLPPQAGIMLPDVTRELIQDDSGVAVLKFFNPLLGTTKYLVRG